ncbi:MAG: lipid A export permease/ATP-binding protein MsbA [Gammaproteobacteria bacterium]|nr:lipid A export permease/ATP-binding protein MsbA [Gammaproteobacteria bacterium]
MTGLQVYRRILSYAIKYWGYLVLAVSGMVLYALTDPAFAALMKPLLDGSFVERDPQVIAWAPIWLIGLVILKGTGGFLSAYYMAYVGRLAVKQVRREMFDQLLHSPVSYFDRSSSGQLISKLTYNVEQIADASTQGLTTLIRDTLTLIGLLGWMFYLNWIMTLAFLLITPIIIGFVFYITKTFRSASKGIQESVGDISHVAEEMIEAQRVVKIFGGEANEGRRFEVANERNRRMMMRWVAAKASSSPFIQLILGIALAGIVYLATVESIVEQVTVGTFVSFMIAMVMLLTPARNLTNLNSLLQRGIAAGQSIFELLDSVREPDQGTRACESCTGKIEFHDVHFRYTGNRSDVLKEISFLVRPGETVALVGRSGSGKSTLINLLPRFYDPLKGGILLDGVDIREYGLKNLRQQMTYVGQDVVLFNDTIANNIAYGQQEKVTPERILEVARAAHATEFIDRLPEGLNTLIGENGVLLSGGQRQRLAIARALLKDVPILVLDEATSSLDTEAERGIQDALERLVENRTTLVIAHRLSTVEAADRILVMDGGRIAERGNHAELMAQEGIYAMLYRLQLRDPEASGPVDANPVGAIKQNLRTLV